MEAPGVVSDQDLQPWLKEKFAKWWSMTKLGYDGVMLQRMERQLKAAEIIADISMKGNTEGITSLYPDNEEDMAVNIGNETHNHWHYEGAPPIAGTPATGTPIPPAVITPPITATPDPPVTVPPPDPIVNTNTTTTSTEKVTERVTEKAPTNKVWPYVAAGALALSGLGGWGMAWYNHNHPVTPPAVVDTDTDNETDVVFPQ